MDTIANDVNISSSIFPVEIDYFKEMYSNSGLKQVTIGIFFIGTIFGLLLEFGIIWYERNGSHRYRTLINQLFVTVSWMVVCYIIFVYIPDGIRYMTGPLDATYCDFHIFLKNFLLACIVLTLDCITLLRYVFIFKLSNFAVVNDDLLATFLQMTIVFLSLWVNMVKRMSLGRMPLNYFMCAGKNPYGETDNEASELEDEKFPTSLILVATSFILNIFALVKIFLYQRKVEKTTQSIGLGKMNQLGNNLNGGNVAWIGNDAKQKKIANLPKSMADLTTQLLCLLFLFVPYIIVAVAFNRIKKVENLNEYENRWLPYSVQIIFTAAGILGISVQYYVRNSSLPKAIWRNIKGYWHY